MTFLQLGCGDYLHAAEFMADRTAGPDVIVGADRHPVSTLMVLEYYNQYHVHSARPMMTLRGEEWGAQYPQWMVTEEDFGQFVNTTDGHSFVRRAIFPTGAVASGISWTIYEHESGRPYVRADSLRELAH